MSGSFNTSLLSGMTLANTGSSFSVASGIQDAIIAGLIGNIGVFTPGGAGGGGGGATPAPTPSPSAPTPAPVQGGSPIDLQILVASLPFVDSGQVIRPEYHNAVVQVLQLMARLMGVGPVSGDLTQTVAPAFFPVFDSGEADPTWEISPGLAVRSSERDSANGWVPVSLPSGARIKQIIVRGRHSASGGTWSVRLERRALEDGETTVVAGLNNLGTVVGTPFERTAAPLGSTPEAIEELRTVDNRKYTYHLASQIVGSTLAHEVALFPVQIVYGVE